MRQAELMLRAGRQWLPADWHCEIIPQCADDPNDFLEEIADGWTLLPLPGYSERENTFYRMELVPGQAVAMTYTEDYGTRRVTIAQDRSFTVAGPPIPDKGNCFRCDFDELYLSIEQMAVGDENWVAPLEPGTHEIQCYYWSDEVPFRFELQSGKGRLVMCAGNH